MLFRSISISKKAEQAIDSLEKDPESMSTKELEAVIKKLTKQMNSAAADLNFEQAAILRDQLVELKKLLTD